MVKMQLPSLTSQIFTLLSSDPDASFPQEENATDVTVWLQSCSKIEYSIYFLRRPVTGLRLFACTCGPKPGKWDWPRAFAHFRAREMDAHFRASTYTSSRNRTPSPSRSSIHRSDPLEPVSAFRFRRFLVGWRCPLCNSFRCRWPRLYHHPKKQCHGYRHLQNGVKSVSKASSLLICLTRL